MFASVFGMTILGLEARLIRVEVDVANGLPNFEIGGLANVAVKEARDRVRSALRNSGFQFPLQRVTVNLAPADLRKEGAGLDLPIAMGILAATAQCDCPALARYVFCGELSLEGTLRSVPGILTRALALNRENKTRESDPAGLNPGLCLLVPPENLAEARLVTELEVHSSSTLRQVVEAVEGKSDFEDAFISQAGRTDDASENRVDWSDIYGQQHAKRALEIAAAGGHNSILIGPPGSGKTLLAKAYAGVLPELSEEESLEVTQLYSVCGLLNGQETLMQQRPFRSPHHTVTKAGMIGGGRNPRPGEISLANYGVLFLDELPEFRREVLECLRQPLEDRELTLTRQGGSITYPAHVSVIASMNPCPCGFYGSQGRDCRCTPLQIQTYRGRISGPLLDRFDIHIDVPRLNYSEISQKNNEINSEISNGIEYGKSNGINIAINTGTESSQTVKGRVMAARQRQWARLGAARTNAEMNAKETRKYCQLTPDGESLLRKIFDSEHLSARAHDRILRTARTIADLAGSPEILPEHLAESIQLRVLDRRFQV